MGFTQHKSHEQRRTCNSVRNFGEFLLFFKCQKAKSPTLTNRASLNRRLAMSYSHMGTPTLPSALLRFTSEFGMGSGGATVLLSLDKKVTILKAVARQSDKYKSVFLFNALQCVIILSVFYKHFAVKLLGCCMVKPHGQLVSVSSRPRSPYTPDLSTL
jgi:hypothetical protein